MREWLYGYVVIMFSPSHFWLVSCILFYSLYYTRLMYHKNEKHLQNSSIVILFVFIFIYSIFESQSKIDEAYILVFCDWFNEIEFQLFNNIRRRYILKWGIDILIIKCICFKKGMENCFTNFNEIFSIERDSLIFN